MTREQVEAVARPVLALAFVVLLAGLSVQLGAALHPIAGWALPTVVTGAAAWWLIGRWLDDRQVAAAADRYAHRGEPLTLPDPPRPG